MSTLFPKPISYEHHTANAKKGYYDDSGKWVKGDTGTGTFYGSVQPASGKDFDSLPSGREDSGMVKVYASVQLPISEENGGEAGALVYWDNRKWELISEGGFQNGLIPHYKYMGQYKGQITP